MSLAPCERAFESRRRGSPLWIARRRWIEGWALARQDDPPRAPPRPAAPLDLLLAAVALANDRRRDRRRRAISGALVKAYLTNPDINTSAPRFARPTSSFPKLTPAICRPLRRQARSAREHTTGTSIIQGQSPINYAVGPFPRSVGITAQETVFDGYATINGIGVRNCRSGRPGAIATHRTEYAAFGRQGLHGRPGYSAIVDLDLNNIAC